MLIVISSYRVAAELWNVITGEVQSNMIFTGEIPHSYYRVFQQYLPEAAGLYLYSNDCNLEVAVRIHSRNLRLVPK